MTDTTALPGLLDLEADLDAACDENGLDFDMRIEVMSQCAWSAELTLAPKPDLGVRAETVVKAITFRTAGQIGPVPAATALITAALDHLGQVRQVIAPGAFDGLLPAEVPVTLGRVGRERIGTARVTADEHGLLGEVTFAAPGLGTIPPGSMSFRIPDGPRSGWPDADAGETR